MKHDFLEDCIECQLIWSTECRAESYDWDVMAVFRAIII
jgi:hypothetical protein